MQFKTFTQILVFVAAVHASPVVLVARSDADAATSYVRDKPSDADAAISYGRRRWLWQMVPLNLEKHCKRSNWQSTDNLDYEPV
ncbi:hypothetical protein MY10362_002849 [Beauveria mimosiformis]